MGGSPRRYPVLAAGAALAILLAGFQAPAQERGFFKEWFTEDGTKLREIEKPRAAREKKSTVTVSDCLKKLEKTPGWCALDGARIRDVFPTGQPRAVRGRTGPAAVVAIERRYYQSLYLDFFAPFFLIGLLYDYLAYLSGIPNLASQLLVIARKK